MSSKSDYLPLPQSVKSLWQQFKDFAFKGNMIDLAVGLVIGAAFGSVVKSMVDNVIMKMVEYVTPNMPYQNWHFGKILFGVFLADLLHFLIVSLAVFIVIVKLLKPMIKQMTADENEEKPATKECPLCLSQIPIKAVKCAHCTADLPAPSTP